MIFPEPEGRPVWEPVIIALSLALLAAYDGDELLALVQGHAALTARARASLELGVAAMMAWGLLTSARRAIRWTPRDDDGA